MKFYNFMILLCFFMRGMPCYSQDVLSGHCQLLVVTNNDWTAKQGSLQLYERSNDDSMWVATGAPIPVVLGKAELAWGMELHSIVDQRGACLLKEEMATFLLDCA